MKFLWDILIETVASVEHIKPDIVLLDKQNESLLPERSPEKNKIRKYDLKHEILKFWEWLANKVITISVIIGAQ